MGLTTAAGGRRAWWTRVARGMALVFAFVFGVLYVGITDLSVLVAQGAQEDPGFYRDVLLEGGRGLLFALLVTVPFLVVGFRPALAPAALVQVGLVGVALGVSGVLAAQPEFLRFTVRPVVCAAVLAVLLGLGGTRKSWTAAPADRQRRTSGWPWLFLALTAAGAAALYAVGLTRQGVGLAVLVGTVAFAVLLVQAGPGTASVGARRMSMPLLLVVTASAVPWGRYALDMVAAAREGRDPVDVTSGFDHWSVQAALGFSVLVVAALAALYLPGWRVPAWTAGTAAAALGAFSMGYPSQAGSLGSDWGTAAAAWGLLVIALAEVSARFRSRATPVAHMSR